MRTIEVVAALVVIWFIFGVLSYFLGLGFLHLYIAIRRRWYRWQGHREFTQGDRVSLEALSRMERKP
jgi:hypothetical protein